ncbi:hypothetical protein N7445_001732 [Penicillium cf. griseofulvum]|nr:hypothetical protein N7445_001732 [Penicillium cf. griseofulvum]
MKQGGMLEAARSERAGRMEQGNGIRTTSTEAQSSIGEQDKNVLHRRFEIASAYKYEDLPTIGDKVHATETDDI